MRFGRSLVAVVLVFAACTPAATTTSTAVPTSSTTAPTATTTTVTTPPTTADPGEQLATPAEEVLLEEVGEAASASGATAAAPSLVTSALTDILSPEAISNEGVFTSEDGGATFTWQVPDRYRFSWSAWVPVGTLEVDDPVPHTERVFGYGAGFVHDDQWPLYLDACRTEAPDDTSLSFSWTIRRGDDVITQVDDTRCDGYFTMPGEGVYEVTMVAESVGGWRDALTANVNLEDIVIVSFGDSSASGEGNPDSSGLDTGWEDSRCHRSRTSGHALTAQALEEASNKSSVTFLSFACSGARISSGILEPYAGQAPIGAVPGLDSDFWQVADLPSQIDAAREALCSVPVEECRPGDMRAVDYLFISIGVNDLAFADVITICANLDLGLSDVLLLPLTILGEILEGSCDEDVNFSSGIGNALISLDTSAERALETVIRCDLTEEEWEARLGYVPMKEVAPGVYVFAPPPYCFDGHSTFGELRRRLDAAGINPTRGVYLSTYPAEPFSDSDGDIGRGCGIFRFVNHDESEFISEWGRKLNELVHLDAVRNGFYSVPGITAAFRGHGYCAGAFQGSVPGATGLDTVIGSDSFFVGFTESVVTQLGIDGTIHPNRRGHEAIRDAFLAAIAAPKPSPIATHQVTLVPARIRFDVPPGQMTARIELVVSSLKSVEDEEIEDGGRLVRVMWNQALELPDLDIVPNQWIPIQVSEPMRIQLSPADPTLEFTAWAHLRYEGNVVFLAPRPDLQSTPSGDLIDVGNAPGGFYQIIFEGPRTDDETSYGEGTYRRRGEVDFGLNEGSMSIEFCVIVSPIRSFRPGTPQQELVNCGVAVADPG